MTARAFAGRLAPGRSDSRAALEAALARDGAAMSAAAGGLNVAWTRPLKEDMQHGDVLCVVDGAPRTAALSDALGLDPSTPPSELLAIGWKRLGERVLEATDGPFAFLLWDAGRGSGLIARDRLGQRPLFIARAQGALLFASEVRNLLRLLPARPAPDRNAVAHWLARTSGPPERTLYEGIEALPPAHLLRLDGHARSRRYWAPRYEEPRPIGVASAAAAVREGLGRAVGRALDGATRPAVMLSGGLDSGAVAAAARTLLPDAPPRAYSVVFPYDPEADESGRIAHVRGALGLDWTEASFAGGSALAAGLEFIEQWELPSLSPNLFVWSPLLRRAAADGADVVLDGEGGDELFGCARYLLADRLRAGRPVGALRLARRLPGMGAHPRVRWQRRALAKYGLRAALPHRLHIALRCARGRPVAPQWLTDRASRALAARDDAWGWRLRPGPLWHAQLAAQLTSGIAQQAADQLRRDAALGGVELRHPLRDPELIDLLLALPPELGFDPHVDRPLLRRALAGELPPALLWDDAKPAFNSVLTRALAGPDLPAVRALLADPHPLLAREVRSEHAAALLEPSAGREPPRAWALDVWRLASLELWLRHQDDPGRAAGALAGVEARAEIVFREGVFTRQAAKA